MYTSPFDPFDPILPLKPFYLFSDHHPPLYFSALDLAVVSAWNASSDACVTSELLPVLAGSPQMSLLLRKRNPLVPSTALTWLNWDGFICFHMSHCLRGELLEVGALSFSSLILPSPACCLPWSRQACHSRLWN